MRVSLRNLILLNKGRSRTTPTLFFCRGGSRTALAFILLALLSACKPIPPPTLFGSISEVDDRDYDRTFAQWTRHAKLYNVLDNVLFASSTFHAPQFRRAFGLKFPDIYGHGGEVTRRELVDLSSDAETFHTFLLKAYTPDLKWNDLDRADSIWRITLTNPDQNITVQAAQISRVKIDANLKAVYGYLGDFDRAYLVRFPLIDPTDKLVIEPHTTKFVMRIASALGTTQMTWDLTPSKIADLP